MEFPEVLAKNLQKLNDTDQRIVEYILQNYEHFANTKINDIANELFISANAIVRLAKKLGYSGYSEMKYAVSHSMQSKQVKESATLKGQVNYKEAVLKAVNRTLDINSKDKIESAARALIEHKKIAFFALGISKNYVKTFIQQLQVFNKICLLSSDRDNAISLAKNIDEDFMAFFLSVSGNTDALLESAPYLKQKKIPIIALTGLNQNNLQNFADVSLYAHAEKHEFDGVDISSRAYLNLILDILMSQIINYYDGPSNDLT